MAAVNACYYIVCYHAQPNPRKAPLKYVYLKYFGQSENQESKLWSPQFFKFRSNKKNEVSV